MVIKINTEGPDDNWKITKTEITRIANPTSWWGKLWQKSPAEQHEKMSRIIRAHRGLVDAQYLTNLQKLSKTVATPGATDDDPLRQAVRDKTRDALFGLQFELPVASVPGRWEPWDSAIESFPARAASFYNLNEANKEKLTPEGFLSLAIEGLNGDQEKLKKVVLAMQNAGQSESDIHKWLKDMAEKGFKGARLYNDLPLRWLVKDKDDRDIVLELNPIILSQIVDDVEKLGEQATPEQQARGAEAAVELAYGLYGRIPDLEQKITGLKEQQATATEEDLEWIKRKLEDTQKALQDTKVAIKNILLRVPIDSVAWNQLVQLRRIRSSIPEKDIFKFVEMAADLGAPSARVRLAEHYAHGWGTPGDYQDPNTAGEQLIKLLRDQSVGEVSWQPELWLMDAVKQLKTIERAEKNAVLQSAYNKLKYEGALSLAKHYEETGQFERAADTYAFIADYDTSEKNRKTADVASYYVKTLLAGGEQPENSTVDKRLQELSTKEAHDKFRGEVDAIKGHLSPHEAIFTLDQLRQYTDTRKRVTLLDTLLEDSDFARVRRDVNQRLLTLIEDAGPLYRKHAIDFAAQILFGKDHDREKGRQAIELLLTKPQR